MYKNKDRYITPHECVKHKDFEGENIEETFSLILHKVEEQDRVLRERK